MLATPQRAHVGKVPLHHQLYAQVLAAIFAGVAVGHFAPDLGASLKPLGDAFIKLVKMVIAPVIFLTIVTGIAGMAELTVLRRVVWKSLGYFLVVSSFALLVGMIVANVFKPGLGMNIDPSTLDTHDVLTYASEAQEQSISGFLLGIIPDSLLSGLANGNILQTLVVAVLVAIAAVLVGKPAKPVLSLLDDLMHITFKVVGIIMRFAPVGAFGAIAFTIGAYGLSSLRDLAELVVLFYATSFLFVVVVLGAIARAAGFSLFKLLRYLRAELVLVLGTASSEAALPSLTDKLQAAGAARSVIGLVVPMGYSFNLDGTNIYMTLAALFIANATGADLDLQQQLALLGIAMISSKGAAGVTGAGFITLAATLSIVPTVPIAGMALILGIDRFMSECRSLTNFIGNAVAALVIAKWENGLDAPLLKQTLDLGSPLEGRSQLPPGE